MDDLELWMLAAAGLVLLAIIASKLSARLGVPVVVLFLVVGMLAGSDGLGNIAFEVYDRRTDTTCHMDRNRTFGSAIRAAMSAWLVNA